MSRYRANVVERVAAAKHIQAKVSGVSQIQERRTLPSSDDFIRDNPGKFEVLTPCGNGDRSVWFVEVA